MTLFPMTMLQLTMVLRDEVAGFRFSGSREKVNHLLFMDDLKPYRRNDFEIERLVGILKGYLNDIGMQFEQSVVCCLGRRGLRRGKWG